MPQLHPLADGVAVGSVFVPREAFPMVVGGAQDGAAEDARAAHEDGVGAGIGGRCIRVAREDGRICG
jgi:hypothetical protein